MAPQPGETTSEHHAFVATYVQLPIGTWMGDLPVLGVTCTGATLEDAREAMRQAIVGQVEAMSDLSQLPASIPLKSATVADRFELTVYLQPSGHRWVLGHSEPCPSPGRSPYLDKDGGLRVLPSVVLVIDELGATARMTEREFTAETLNERSELLRQARTWLGEAETEDIEAIAVYTDNLVHAAPLEHGDPTSRLGLTISTAAHYQLTLARFGTLLRGGLAIGKHHQSPSIVAGPALIEAHTLEMKHAVHPRILLSLDAIIVAARGVDEWAWPGESPWATQLILDQDDQIFISYLSATAEADAGQPMQARLIQQHREQIVDGLRETRSNRHQHKKWLWLAAYHDYYVRSEELPRRLRVRRVCGWRRKFRPAIEILTDKPLTRPPET